MNARSLAAEPRRDPAALASLLRESCRLFLDASATSAPEDRVPTPWYGEGTGLRLDEATCLLTGEQLVHGLDIARAAARSWPIDDRTARVAVRASMAMMPLIVDPGAAAGVTGAWDVRIRGGPRYTVRIDRGIAAVDPPSPGAVDCHIAADPAAMVLVGYGRVSQWRMIARGRMLAWGRRPWMALRLKGMFFDP